MKLRTRLALNFLLFVVLLGIVLMAFVRVVMLSRLTEAHQKRGVSMASHFAEMATDHVLIGDSFSLRMLALGFVGSEDDIEYVFVLNRNGSVLAHSFKDGFPADLRDANPLAPGQQYSIQPLATEHGKIYDTASPILGGEAGAIHLGISAEPISREIAALTRLTLTIIALVLVAGVALAGALAVLITRPVTELVKAAEAIGGGNLGYRVPIHRGDEIGRLSATFNEMADKLKGADEELRQAIEVKDVLMKEVHHRVKNNLAVIVGLLKLQSRRISDEKAKGYFGETENRVMSMSMIHERLYRSEDMTRIDSSEYIRSLAAQLFRSYRPDSSRVRLNVEVEEVSLDIDTMVPLGLIINELVSNALKYAFPEGRHGELLISLANGDDGDVTLTVKDDGVGLPEGMDIRKTESLGMQIVVALTAQIGGEIEFASDGGTGFTITFNGR